MAQIIAINTSANPAYADVTGTGSAAIFPNFAAFPSAAANPGLFAIDASNGYLYCAFAGNWCFMLILAPAS